MSYTVKVGNLFAAVHADVKPLFNPATQKRKFPKRALAKFLARKDIRDSLAATQPGEITKLVNSTDELDLVPSEILTVFLADIWELVPENIKKAIEGAKD